MNYGCQIRDALTILAAFHSSYLGIAGTSSGDSSPKACERDFFISFSNNA